MKITTNRTFSSYGTFMFNLCASVTEYLVKHKWLYYLLAYTWGILMTLLGYIITLILLFVKLFCKDNIKLNKYYWIYGIKVGPDWWGGFEMGLMFCRDQKSSDSYVNRHEFGHTFQNCLLGPLFPFLVAIPSALRYWIRNLRTKKGKSNNDYDAIWFECSATECGKYVVDYLDKNK